MNTIPSVVAILAVLLACVLIAATSAYGVTDDPCDHGALTQQQGVC